MKNLKILLQNVHKNSLIVNTLLETQNQFDIIFIQESPWSKIHKIPSSSSHDGEPLMKTNNHYLSTIEVGLYVKIDFRFDNPLLIFGRKHEKPTKMPYISWSENRQRR